MDHAGHDRHIVKEDRASAAFAFGAAFLGAGQLDIVAQPMQKRLALSTHYGYRLAINRAANGRIGMMHDANRQSALHNRMVFAPEHRRALGQARFHFVLGQLAQGANNQDFHHLPPIIGAAANIVDRRSGLRGDATSLPDSLVGQALAKKKGFGSRHADDGRRHAAQRDSGCGNPIGFVQGQHHRHVYH